MKRKEGSRRAVTSPALARRNSPRPDAIFCASKLELAVNMRRAVSRAAVVSALSCPVVRPCAASTRVSTRAGTRRTDIEQVRRHAVSGCFGRMRSRRPEAQDATL